MKKLFKSTLIYLSLCMITFILINAYYSSTRQQNHVFIQSVDKNAGNEIKGIKLTHHLKEKKLFSIQAETASIKKKKIGFFRIGGLKQLELKNMVIDYYVPFIDQARSDEKQHPPEIQHSSEKAPQDLISCFSYTTRSLPIFNDSLSGFVADHATLRYHHLDGSLTIINAPCMEIDTDKKNLIFRVNASVHYQKKFLLCKHLNFDLQHSFLISRDRYTFINNGKMAKGKGIRTNLRLDRL
ncbi:MAG: hypothetical protein HQK75_03660 [Candidatus Magnetomorum sp.]|nr:hypothetical protein [Candidatus Magnetomorum sp.]